MQPTITGRNVEITDYTRSYIEKKLQRVERHLPALSEIRVELVSESAKGAPQRNVAQVTLRAGGVILRGEERGADVFSAIDAVMEKVVRQVERFKGKREHARKKGNRQAEPVTAGELSQTDAEYIDGQEAGDLQHPIVRTKRFQTAPMGPQEAIEQMELLGHNFFVFYNADDGNVNVVYRRTHGDYGLLVPELS